MYTHGLLLSVLIEEEEEEEEEEKDEESPQIGGGKEALGGVFPPFLWGCLDSGLQKAFVRSFRHVWIFFMNYHISILM